MAKKFKFRLETVLNIKTKKVDEAKNELYKILSVRYEKEKYIADLESTKNQELKKSRETSLKAQEMQMFKDYINTINYNIQKAYKELEKVIEIENIKRNELNEALREEKALTKLKNKKLEEHKKELKTEETNFLNEIGNQIYLRSNK